MRSPLRYPSLALLCAFSACTELGGQTGDPGVADSSSLDPDPTRPGSWEPTACVGLEILDPEQVLDSSGRPSAPLGDGHLLVHDTARGLSVIDVSGPAPRLAGRLPLELASAELHVVGTRALLSRRAPKPYASYFANDYPEIPDEAELLVVDLSDPERPRQVASLTPEHIPSATFVVTTEGRTRLYAFSDETAPIGCSVLADPRARLASYELAGDRLVPRAELDLDTDVYQLAQAGTALAVVHRENWQQTSSFPAQLSLVSLTSADGALAEGARVELAGDHLLGAHLDGDALRVVSSATADSTVHVERYAVADRAALVRQGDCVAGTSLDYGSLVYGATHTFFRARGTAFSVAVGADGSCDVRNTPRGMLAITSSGARVLEIDRDGSSAVAVTLLDESALSPLAQASAQPAPSLTSDGYGSQVLTRGRAASAPDETGVLAVPYWIGGTDVEEQGLQLFSFNDQSVRARGALAPAYSLRTTSLVETPEHVLMWGPTGLARVKLDDLDAPVLSEPLDVAPRFLRLWDFAGNWVRLRSAVFDPEEGINLSSEDALFAPPARAMLELLPDSEDPDRGAPVASLEVHPWAHYVRVGELLVGVVRMGTGPQRTQFEVIDLRDPAHPRAAGRLLVPALDMPEPLSGRLGSLWSDPSAIHFCLDCAGVDQDQRALVVPGALVLRSLNEAGELALQVLDVSDPDAPALSAPISAEPGERPLSAFAHGSSVYATYRISSGAAEGGVDLPRARFYFKRIDLSEPARPVIGEAVQVPGQLVAVDGERLFVREFVRRGTNFETVVHRLALRDGRAELRASHSFGGRMAFALQLDGAGHLLADLGPALSDFLFTDSYEMPATDLHVLDAETLKRLGGGRVAVDARRLAIEAGRALYSAAEGYVLMDLHDPSTPRFQRYLRVLDPYSTQRAALIDSSVVIRDGGALRRFPAAER